MYTLLVVSVVDACTFTSKLLISISLLVKINLCPVFAVLIVKYSYTISPSYKSKSSTTYLPSLSADIVILSFVVNVYVFESTWVVKEVYLGTVIDAGVLAGNTSKSITAFDDVCEPGK